MKSDAHVKEIPYPKSIVIETTLRCNLRCIHCVSAFRRADYNADMRPEILEKVWPIVERAEDVALDNQGEFFCNKDYLSIFRRVRDMGKHTTITTNGALLRDDVIDKVVFDGLTNLNISIDGADAATHEKFRIGSDYEKLMAALRKICERKQASGADLPHIGLNFLTRRSNIEQTPAIVDLAHELGVDHLYVFHLFVFDRNLEEESLFHHQELSDRCLLEARERNRGKRLELHLPDLFSECAKHGRKRFRKCDFPLTMVSISARGDVLACCDLRMSMGNLGEEPFEEIWNSNRYMELRKTVNGPSPDEVCANCVYPYLANTANPAVFFEWDAPRSPLRNP